MASMLSRGLKMVHNEDPKQLLLNKIGDLENINIYHDEVLCAIYQRPEKTQSGILLPDKTRDEEYYQGKVGLIIKVGPRSFKDKGDFFKGSTPQVGEWVFFRASDGFSIEINGVKCRIVRDELLLGSTLMPDDIW